MSIDLRRNLRRIFKATFWLRASRRLRTALYSRGQDHALRSHPVQHLHKIGSADAGITVWKTDGANPYFCLTPKDGGAFDLPSGWYLLNIPLAIRNGLLESPKLHLDHGSGFSSLFFLALRHLCAPHGIRGLVRFDYPVFGLHFDPGSRPCEFALGAISLQRVSKFTAALYMYGALVRKFKKPVSLVGRMLREYVHGGMRKVGDWLYAQYMPLSERRVGPVNYQEWVSLHDTITIHEWKAMRRASRLLDHRPVVSIVMPVYNTPEVWLHRCIRSVLRQAYPYWELCIADDASTEAHVRTVLERYAAQDWRIKLTFRESNGHISEASNSALALAKGEWVALLDHDDELPSHALFLIAKAINERPQVGLLYSDEDKIDEDGCRFDPYFKPDWNPDLFHGQNMISHLGAYRKTLVQEVGGFRTGYEGSQDYDLALRCIEKLRAEQIVHIPRVLYHWRAISGSTALKKDEKSYATIAGERALNDHLARTGVRDAVARAVDHGYRVRRMISGTSQPKVSLIIPTRDRVDLLRMCVETILKKTDYANYEIVIVDNQSIEASTLAYFEDLRGEERVRVINYDAPFNYSSINNVAVSSTEGDIIGLINNDIEVINHDWLSEMVSQVIRPDVGVVGAMLYYPNDTIQHAGVVLGIGGVANHAYAGMPRGYTGQMSRAALVQNLSAVTAACLLVRRTVYDAVGGFDTRLQVAFNDVDFCLRVRALGLRNVWTPYAELYHHESASRGIEDTPEKHERFVGEVAFMTEHWGEQLSRDPAYNPNLSMEKADFSLARHPRVAPLIDIASGKAALLDASR